MNDLNTLRFILHVSDFHLRDDENEVKYAQSALKALSDKLKSERIKVDYLFFTGDIVDSSDIYEKASNNLSTREKYLSSKKTLMLKNSKKKRV